MANVDLSRAHNVLFASSEHPVFDCMVAFGEDKNAMTDTVEDVTPI